MKSILRGVRPLDYVLAAAMTALGIVLMTADIRSHGSTRIDSRSWALVPVFAAATAPILWRRRNLWAVLGVTALALGVHTLAFGWEVRCGAGLPLTFALAYSVGRLTSERRQSYAALATVVGIQFLVLVHDSAAGLGILPVTAVIALAIWGVGLYVRKRSERSLEIEVAAPVESFA
jgi:hypothetical protein